METFLSERIKIFDPSRICDLASKQILSSASLNSISLVEFLNRISMTEALSFPLVLFSIFLILEISLLVKIGCFNSSLAFVFCSGESKIFGFSPSVISRDITSSSRIGSIGGLVTCAKHCLK